MNVLLTVVVILLTLLAIVGVSCCRKMDNFSDTYSKKKKAIVVVSIGGDKRPFFKYLKPYYLHYADKVGADLLVYEYTSMNEVPKKYLNQIRFYDPKSKDRLKFRMRMMKMVYLREALQTYERVILMDDSCFIMPDTPDMFSIVPVETLGVVSDFGLLGKMNGHKSVNTGVMVVSQPQRWFFEDFKARWKECDKAVSSKKFTWVGVDQSFINYAINVKKSLGVTLMPPSFNVVTSLITDKMIKNRKAYVYHFTGTHEDLKLRRTKLLVKLNPLD
jgi:hypothetical protein